MKRLTKAEKKRRAERRRVYVRASLQKRRVRLKAEGLCVDCGKNKAGASHVVCAVCRQARVDREHIRQVRLATARA